MLKHYPDLDVEGKTFRKAIESGENKGQLRRITGNEIPRCSKKIQRNIPVRLISGEYPLDVIFCFPVVYAGEWNAGFVISEANKFLIDRKTYSWLPRKMILVEQEVEGLGSFQVEILCCFQVDRLGRLRIYYFEIRVFQNLQA